MFKQIPKVLSHISALKNGNFVTPEYIINNENNFINLFHRFCPHRMYPISKPGEIIKEIKCDFHNFKWSQNGNPINNNKKIKCGSAQLGKSGLIFKDFVEPNSTWVNDLSIESNLEYSHSIFGESKGSWLWYMDINADLLHVNNEIHPVLSKQISISDVIMEQGDSWILQRHNDGWWLFIFPFTAVEYGKSGKLAITNVLPNNINEEFGFSWHSQIFYDPKVNVNDKLIFETLKVVIDEDIKVVEKQKGKYFPLTNASSYLENHCIHWGNWFMSNKK